MPKASRAKPTPAAKRFDARLERLRSRLNWIIVRIPFDAAKAWGLRGQIKVKGEINGFAFRTSLFPTREGWHFLLINKQMQKEARAVEGSVARFQMELDSEERTVTIPDELKRILSEDRSLRRWYDGLNPPATTSPSGSPNLRAVMRASVERNKLRNACSPSWRRNGNCHPFSKSLSRAIHALAKVGIECPSRVVAGTCLASSTTELRTPEPAASTKCSMTPMRSPRK